MCSWVRRALQEWGQGPGSAGRAPGGPASHGAGCRDGGWSRRGARGGGEGPVDVAVHAAARCVLSFLDRAGLDWAAGGSGRAAQGLCPLGSWWGRPAGGSTSPWAGAASWQVPGTSPALRLRWSYKTPGQGWSRQPRSRALAMGQAPRPPLASPHPHRDPLQGLAGTVVLPACGPTGGRCSSPGTARLCLGCDGRPCAAAQRCGLGHTEVPCPLQSPSVALRVHQGRGTLQPLLEQQPLPAPLQTPQPLPALGRRQLPPGTAGGSRRVSLQRGMVTPVHSPCGMRVPTSDAPVSAGLRRSA